MSTHYWTGSNNSTYLRTIRAALAAALSWVLSRAGFGSQSSVGLGSVGVFAMAPNGSQVGGRFNAAYSIMGWPTPFGNPW